MTNLPLCAACQVHHATIVTCPPWTWNIVPSRVAIEEGKRRNEARLFRLRMREESRGWA